METFRQSTTPVVPVAKFTAGVVDTGCIFAAIVIDTGGAPLLVNISLRIFDKIWNDFSVIFRDLGEDDSWKKKKISWHCPFKSLRAVVFLDKEASWS